MAPVSSTSATGLGVGRAPRPSRNLAPPHPSPSTKTSASHSAPCSLASAPPGVPPGLRVIPRLPSRVRWRNPEPAAAEPGGSGGRPFAGGRLRRPRPASSAAAAGESGSWPLQQRRKFCHVAYDSNGKVLASKRFWRAIVASARWALKAVMFR